MKLPRFACLFLGCLLFACGGKGLPKPSPPVLTPTAIFTTVDITSTPSATFTQTGQLSLTATPVTQILRPTRTRWPTFPQVTPTQNPTLKIGPTFTYAPPKIKPSPAIPTPTFQLTPATPAAGPEGYRLKPWTEMDAWAAVLEARSIVDKYLLSYASRFPYLPYDAWDYQNYLLTVEREALLRPLDTSHRDSIIWDVLSRLLNLNAGIPLEHENFAVLLQEALNSGQVSPEDLKAWLKPRRFEVVVSLTVENLAGDGKVGLVLQIKNTYQPWSPDGVFAVLGGSADKYRVFQIHPWQNYWHGVIRLEAGDRNGNGQPEIAVMTYFYGSGSTTSQMFRIHLYEWQPAVQHFTNLTENVPMLQLDRFAGPGFVQADQYPWPWYFDPPDANGVQTLTIRLIDSLGHECPFLESSITYRWDGVQYHWASKMYAPLDQMLPITCQVAWALLTGAQDSRGLAVLQTALVSDSPDLLKDWGPAIWDYLRLQLGILYALTDQPQQAVQALQTVRDQPDHPEFSMASQLAGVFLDDYTAEQTFTACNRTIRFLTHALSEQISTSINFGYYSHDTMKGIWGFDDPRWVYDGTSVCDIQVAFRQSLLSYNPQNLEQFVLWLNRTGINHEIVQTADLTGDGTQDWIVILQIASGFMSDIEWPVWVIVRDWGGLDSVLIDSFYVYPDDPRGVTFTTLRPDPALLPVVILTRGNDLIIFRLVQAKQLGVEILFTNGYPSPDHVLVDHLRQEITIFYPGNETMVQYQYTWVPELQTFNFPKYAPILRNSFYEKVSRIENLLFGEARPAEVISPLVTLLAGDTQELRSDDPGVVYPPRNRSYLQYLLGLAYEVTGDEANAVNIYWQIWHDYPNNPYALMARHKLTPILP